MYAKYISFDVSAREREYIIDAMILGHKTINNSGTLILTYPDGKCPYDNTHTPTRFSFLKSAVKRRPLRARNPLEAYF